MGLRLNFVSGDPSNLWFDGGSWTCAWGAGVIACLAQEAPDLLTSYRRVGGYSAGGWLALMVHIGATQEQDLFNTLHHSFYNFGNYRFWTRETLRRTWLLDRSRKLQTDPRLQLHALDVLRGKSVIRHVFQTMGDFLDFGLATAQVPGMCGGWAHHVAGVGPCIDGGALQRAPHAHWDGQTFIVSPWRQSSSWVLGPSKIVPLSLLILPNSDLMINLFQQGREDALKWLAQYHTP